MYGPVGGWVISNTYWIVPAAVVVGLVIWALLISAHKQEAAMGREYRRMVEEENVKRLHEDFARLVNDKE